MNRKATFLRALVTAVCCAAIVFLLGRLWAPRPAGKDGMRPRGGIEVSPRLRPPPVAAGRSRKAPFWKEQDRSARPGGGQPASAVVPEPPGMRPESSTARPPAPVFRLQGVVVGEAGGAAIPNATVKAIDLGARTPRARTARTDADGRFVIAAVPEGEWRVVCGARGFRPERRDVAIFAAEPIESPEPVESPEPIEFALEKDSGIPVWVTNRGGDPVSGARVELRARRHGVSRHRGAQKTGPRGAARVFGLPEWEEARAQLVVTHPDYADYRRIIEPASPAGPIRVTLTGAATVRGTVFTASGDPCRGARVHLVPRDRPKRQPRSLRTIASGEFRFEKVPPGDYRLEAVTITAGAAAQDVNVTAGAGGSPSPPLSIRLREGPQRIDGIVRDRTGDPVVLCPVRVVPEDREGARTIKVAAGEDGRFAVRGLAKGRYRVEAGGDRRYSLDRRAAGPETRVVELQVDRLGSIEGRLEGFDSTAVVAVRVAPSGAERAVIRPRNVALSGSRERFRVPYLPPAEYRLEVIRRDGEAVGPGRELRVEPAEVARVVLARELRSKD